MGNAINTWNINELVRDALISRYHVIQSSRLFSAVIMMTGLRFEKVISKKYKGAAIVINMGKATPVVRRMIVELVLSKLVDLLEKVSDSSYFSICRRSPSLC